MAKIRQLQTNFTSGVMDPKLGAREDIVFYYNALKDGRNVLIMPQGGATRRPAGRFVRELSREFQAIDLSGMTITAPAGGTAANGRDGDEDTAVVADNNLGTTNPVVLIHLDCLAPVAVTAIDVVNFKLSAGVLNDEFRVQFSADNAAWTDYGTPFDWDASPRSRRVRSGDGDVTARYWRVVRIGVTDVAGKPQIGELRLWGQAGTLSGARLLPFAYSTEEAYMFVASDRNIDVLTGYDYQGSISIPHISAQLPVMNWSQSLDTMLLFHGNVQTWKIFRQGDDDEFDFRKFNYQNIPQYDYGAGVGGADDVQTLDVDGASGGNRFTILLDGERTEAITVGDAATTAANIQAALRALNNTSADGIVVAANGASLSDGITVTFSGDDGKQEWGDMTISVLSGNGVWSISHTTKGKPPGENIMSDARGWPRCGTFHQSRLHAGGIPGVPDAWLASVLGEIENFDIDQDDATRALMFRSDADQVGAIYQIFAGRHLSFFANDGEFYVPTEKIDHESILKRSTSAGSKEGMRIFDVDGALMFMQGVKGQSDARERASSVREFLFVDTEQAYAASLVSKLSSHLIKNPVDWYLRKALSTDEADILLLVNEDGTGTAYTLLRTDTVNAFVPFETRRGDRYLAVGVDKKRRVYFVVERTINGEKRRYVEMWDENLFLDCGDIVAVESEEFTATEGQTVFTWSFDNPAESDAIGVRLNGGRIDDGYSVDLGTKTITLDDGVEAGTVVRVARMIKTLTGLDHLEGETVQTFIDGTQGADYTVAGGVLDLDEYADTEIQYGFDFEVYMSLMPFRIPDSQTLSGEKLRCSAAILNLYQTSGVMVRANNGRWRDVPLSRLDSNVLDRSTMELLFTGEREISGMPGHAIGAPFEIKQPGPGPFTLLGVTREVVL